MAVSHVFSSPVADKTGTVTNWDGATTASALATEQVRPSDWNSAHLQFMTVTGNTVGQSTFSGTNIVIGGGANITLSGVNATQLNIVGGAGGAGGSLNLSAGTTSNNLTAVTFSDSNGVSFGLNGSVVTATVQTNYLTTAMLSNAVTLSNIRVSGGTTSNLLSAITFADGNGVSFGLNAGTMTASHNALTSQSNQNVTAGNGGFAFQTLSFSNVNGISFGTSAGSAITASHNAITTGRASNDGIGLNTAQTNVTWTVNSSGLSLNAAGYAGTGTTFNGANISGSVTLNSVGLQLSLSAATAAPSPVNISAGTTSDNLASVVFSNSNGVSFGLDGSTITASVAPGGGANTISHFINTPLFSASASGAYFQSTSALVPFALPGPLSMNFLRMHASITTNSTSFATTINTSLTAQRFSTFNVVVYKQMTGANSRSLESVGSTSVGFTQLISLTANSTGSQYSVFGTITYPTFANTTTATFSYASSQTRFDLATGSLTAFTGARYLDVPWGTSLDQSNYWLAVGQSTNSSTQGVAGASNLNAGITGLFVARATNLPFNQFGIATSASNGALLGAGQFTIAGGGTTASLALSLVSSEGNNPVLAFQMIRLA